MKKEDILKETQELVNEYLGHNELLINGCNWTKERLLNRLNAYKEMVNLKREADKLLSKNSDAEIMYMVMAEKVDKTIVRAYELKQKAHEIWLKRY